MAWVGKKSELLKAYRPSSTPSISAAHLGLVNGVAFLLMLQGRPKLSFAFIDPGNKVVAVKMARG